MNKNKFFAVALLVTLTLAGVVSFYASSNPDGLEKVAEEGGFISNAQDHSLANSPLADYSITGISDGRLSVGVAGAIGVVAMLLISTLLFKFIARRK